MDTLERLAAVEAIKELKYRYSRCMDSKDLDRMIVLFADDARCEFGPEIGTWSGRQAILDGYASQLDQYPGEWPFLHIALNPVIELIDADHAVGQWYLVHVNASAAPSANPLAAAALYEDAYVKRDGRWLFAQMKLQALWPKRAA